MRKDVIKQIERMDDIRQVIILTHNIDFVFVQSVLLSALKKCGHPSITLFADSGCAFESYRYQSQIIRGLGRRYRVIPVQLNGRQRFHPKAIFLAGEQGATLFVGSGNMTFGGTRENFELWYRFDTANGEFSEISYFQDYLHRIQSQLALDGHAKNELERAFNPVLMPWVEQLDEPGGLFGRVADGHSFLQHMKDTVGESEIQKITICTPYFDEHAQALIAVSKAFNNPPIDVLIQDRRSTLLNEAANCFPSNINIRSLEPKHDDERDGERKRFIHAKYFAFESKNGVTVYGGSANCSLAALILEDVSGNAELMAVRRMSPDQYQRLYLSEFSVAASKPTLLSAEEIDEKPEESKTYIALLAARYEDGELEVGYRVSHGFGEIHFLLDNERAYPSELTDEKAWFPTISIPKEVVAEVTSSQQVIRSNPIWVDDESMLHTTSRQRTARELLSKSERMGAFDHSVWSLVLENYTTDLADATALGNRSVLDESKEEDTKETRYTWDDVFRQTYRSDPHNSQDILSKVQSNTVSIQKILLLAFGYVEVSHEEDPVDADGLDSESDDTEDTVDTKATIAPKKKEKNEKNNKLTDAQKRRIKSLVESLTERLVDDEFLGMRSPRQLAKDIHVVGLLLIVGYVNKWITDEVFYNCTQRIWGVLFLSASEAPNIGWIGKRLSLEDEKGKFIEAFRSEKLAATLLLWQFVVPKNGELEDQLRFSITAMIAAGKHPWIWRHKDMSGVNEWFARIASESGVFELEDLNELIQYISNWENFHKSGLALIGAIQEAEEVGLEYIRNQIDETCIEVGDLIWQGKKGLCIVLNQATDSKQRVQAYSLNNPESKPAFIASYIVPVRAMIDVDVLPDSEYFDKRHRDLIGEYLLKIRQLFEDRSHKL